MKEKDRAIIQLRRELIDVDTQLDSERRKRTAMRAALEKNSVSHRKEPRPTTSSSTTGSPEKTPMTSFRLSTRSPPVSPSPYRETKGAGGRDNPPPAQTPEAPSSSSRLLSEEYSSSQHRGGLGESRHSERADHGGSSSSTRSGSAPHSRVIPRSKFLESKQTLLSSTATVTSTTGLSQRSGSQHGSTINGSSSSSASRTSRGAAGGTGQSIPIPSWEVPSSARGSRGSAGR
jgi:hypothetical protein